MDPDYIQQATDVFLESNTFVKVADADIRKRMAKAYTEHLTRGWEMKRKAEAELAQRAGGS